MSNDEIIGKLAVLEAFAMTALGLYLANASNDPDYSKAKALMEWLKNSAFLAAMHLPPNAQNEAKQYAAALTETLSKNIRLMRGEFGSTQ